MHRFFSAGFDEAVGVFALGEEHEADGASVVKKRQCLSQGARSGFASRKVSVETEDQLVAQAEKLLEVFACDRGSERCHRVFDAVGEERDDVHVPLDDDDLVEFSDFSYLVRAVKRTAFMKDLGFRRVQIFRLVFVLQDAPAESDGVPLLVSNREHQTVAELVVGASRRVVFPEQPRLEQQPIVADAREKPFQLVKAFGGVSQAESRRGVLVDASLREIFARGGGSREFGAVKLGRLGERLEDLLAVFADRRAACFPRHLDSGELCERFDRFDEVHLAVFHQELDGGSARPATEAVIKLFLRVDRKRRRLFFVERAAGHVFPAFFLQLHEAADDFYDVAVGQKLVYEV